MKRDFKLQLNQAQSRLTNRLLSVAVLAFGAMSCLASAQLTPAQSKAPNVFQAAGPSLASIQGTVDQFRAALGGNNNGNNPGLTSGRREINWDGGSTTNAATSLGSTPFTAFLNNRGANITTPGSGFVQAPPSGLADTFGNSSYATIFSAFSPLRLFSPIGSNVTVVEFFVPGSSGNTPATSTGFGAVFTDVDQQARTVIEYFGTRGELLFRRNAPAAPGDGNLSFIGVVFSDARVARVRITAGNAAPGPNDDGKIDIVMMDDFFYGEPIPLF